MKILLFFLFTITSTSLFSQNSSSSEALEVLKKVDKNMFSETQIVTSEMIVYGKRKSRTIRSKGYSEGEFKNFTEYLYPDREKGTKMLKLDDRLWIYSPSTDRIIQLSGHLLRQSVMGSDLSYEDMMEERKLSEIYFCNILSEEVYKDRPVWKMELIAKNDNVSYFRRIVLIDKLQFVPLESELYAKSGELLKKTVFSEIKKIEGKWYPTKMNYKDILKGGKGTDFLILDVVFNKKIPDSYFLKASLKK